MKVEGREVKTRIMKTVWKEADRDLKTKLKNDKSLTRSECDELITTL